MGRKKNPATGVWDTLFEPVYTGGRPSRALGDLGTPKGEAHTPRDQSDSLSNKHWFKISGTITLSAGRSDHSMVSFFQNLIEGTDTFLDSVPVFTLEFIVILCKV